MYLVLLENFVQCRATQQVLSILFTFKISGGIHCTFLFSVTCMYSTSVTCMWTNFPKYGTFLFYHSLSFCIEKPTIFHPKVNGLYVLYSPLIILRMHECVLEEGDDGWIRFSSEHCLTFWTELLVCDHEVFLRNNLFSSWIFSWLNFSLVVKHF